MTMVKMDKLLMVDTNGDEILFEVTDSKVRDAFVTPEMFGAKGDGVTDDTVAVNACFANENCKVIVLKNDYVISDSIDVYDDTVVYCFGLIKDKYTNTSKNSPEKGLFNADNKTNIKFYNLKVEGRGAGVNTAYKEVLNFEQCSNVSIFGGKFTDIPATWVIRFNACDGTIVEKVIIERYSYGGIGNLNGGKNHKVLNCTLIDLYTETSQVNTYPIMLNGYEMNPITAPMGENLMAVGNYIYNSDPYWECIDAHGGKNIIVKDNICDNCYTGIAVFSDYIRGFETENVIVANNEINCATEGTQRSSVGCYGIVCDGKGFLISNNIIRNGGSLDPSDPAGIYSRNGENGKIIHNIILNAKYMGIHIGICKNVTIEANEIRNVSEKNNSSFGLYFTSTDSAYYDNVIVKNNIIEGVVNFYQGPYTQLGINRGAYVGFENNTYIGSGSFVRLTTHKPDKCTPSDIGSIKMGRLGDKIYNRIPSTGNPIGWICTRATSANDDAIWSAMPNL